MFIDQQASNALRSSHYMWAPTSVWIDQQASNALWSSHYMWARMPPQLVCGSTSKHPPSHPLYIIAYATATSGWIGQQASNALRSSHYMWARMPPQLVGGSTSKHPPSHYMWARMPPQLVGGSTSKHPPSHPLYIIERIDSHLGQPRKSLADATCSNHVDWCSAWALCVFNVAV